MVKDGCDFPAGRLTVGVRVLAILAALSAPFASSAAAAAVPPPPSPPFSACPEFPPTVETCVYAEEAGSLSIGRGSATIVRPLELQGGVTSPTFYWANPATDTLPPSTALLIGGVPPGPELTATIELPPPIPIAPQPPPILDGAIELNLENEVLEDGTALRLPLQVKIGSKNPGLNALLGSNCHVAPIPLHLTTGTTSPPAPNVPIKGKAGELEPQGESTYLIIKGSSLVDNAFAEPEATGCGPGNPLIDPLVTTWVNTFLELPSPAGHNTAILNGTLETYGL